MATSGDHIDFLLALEATAILAAALGLQASSAPALARFWVLVLAGPFVVSLKHGFVRQDFHVANFFCFVALALALMSLTVRLENGRRILPFLIAFVLVWQDVLVRQAGLSAVAQSSGAASAQMLWRAFPLDQLGKRLGSSSVAEFPQSSRIEPELIAVIGDSPVASLSNVFTNLAADGLRVVLFPSIQRFSAYTAWLDGWDAAWIRDKGPKFLVFDGKSIDYRDPWAETPAMWLEIYRWYDTRLLGPRNLLLERRAVPRFNALESIAHFRVGLNGKLDIPVSADPVFWTMKCRYSNTGLIRKAFARLPSVTISVRETGGATRSARVIPEVLGSPVMGSYLPADLAQFAAVFDPGASPGYSVDQIQFGGPGATSYTSACEAELLRPAR